MRMVFLLLVMANLVFFVWAQGYMRDANTGHEPQRLTDQLQPEAIKLLHELPPARDGKALTCRRITNLAPTAAAAIRTAWETEPGWMVNQTFTGAGAKEYRVAIAALTTEALAQKKRAELGQLNIKEAQVIADQANGPYLVLLATYADEAAAKRFLDALPAKGVRSARLFSYERETPTTMELRGPPEKFEDRLKQLALPAAATADECAPGDAGVAGANP